MKNKINYIICQFILLVFALLMFFVFVPKYLNNINTIEIVSLLVIAIITFFTLGYKQNNNRFSTDAIQIIIIFLFVYYIVYYLLGLFVGFYKNIYSLKILSIITNLLSSIVPIVLIEYIRFMNSSKVKSRILLLTLTLILASIEIAIFVPRYTFADFESIFKFCGLVLIPIIAKNILFTYLTNKSGVRNSIVYRLITESTMFVLPIVPNLGAYLDSIINTALPIVTLIRLEKIDLLSDKRHRVRLKSNNIFTIPIIILLLIIITLVSGIFKYRMIGVMSNSMKPIFQRGDALIIEDYTEEETKNIEKGVIIQYQLENKQVVHRVTKIIKNGNEVSYITKGDNNDKKDPLEVKPDQILGKVILRVKYIGFPSVWIHDIIN